MICPCKGCEDRIAGCHGKCENYKEWKRAIGSYTEEVRQARAREHPPVSAGNEKRWYQTLKDRKK